MLAPNFRMWQKAQQNSFICWTMQRQDQRIHLDANINLIINKHHQDHLSHSYTRSSESLANKFEVHELDHKLTLLKREKFHVLGLTKM